MIVLVGFMGAGKTTVGRLLAARLGLPFTDSDQVIEERAGTPIRQIFADDGEPAFRELEHEVIADLLDGPDAVLALGGGAADRADTRDLLKPPRSSTCASATPRRCSAWRRHRPPDARPPRHRRAVPAAARRSTRRLRR